MPARKTDVHFALAVISPDCFSPISQHSPAIRSYSWSAAVGKSTLLSIALWPPLDITDVPWQTQDYI